MWQVVLESKRLGLASISRQKQAYDRDVGKQSKKDTWLLKGIVPTPLCNLVRFFNNSLNLFR